MEGLENLAAEPTGWLFGQPSALYSNEVVSAPVEPMMATEEASMPMAAPSLGADAPMGMPVDGAAPTGRVVPTSPSSMVKKGRKKRAKRVPPSTPEEIEAARRGEYDYTGGQ